MQAGKTGTTGILVFDFELFKDSAKMKELATLSGGKLFSDIGRFFQWWPNVRWMQYGLHGLGFCLDPSPKNVATHIEA